jgi:hypothetical protein
MEYEALMPKEQEAFERLLQQHGVVGQYQTCMRRIWSNWGTPGRTVTILHPKSGKTASYFADHHPENPRYWLRRLSRALSTGTFGEISLEDRRRAERRYTRKAN